MVNTIINFEWTGWMGILLYWLPLAICSIGYLFRTWANVQKDLAAREKYETWRAGNPEPNHLLDRGAWDTWYAGKVYPYSPTDTIGTLIGRGLASIIPVVNLLCAVCDIAPKALRDFFKTIGDVFDQPLVPKK